MCGNSLMKTGLGLVDQDTTADQSCGRGLGDGKTPRMNEDQLTVGSETTVGCLLTSDIGCEFRFSPCFLHLSDGRCSYLRGLLLSFAHLECGLASQSFKDRIYRQPTKGEPT
ncbi:hypothetical protein FPOAC2_05588 [Fusarium poae]